MDLKNCLGLILLTGLVTGYLYTLLATREKYKPKLDRLKKETAEATEQIKTIETEYAKLQEETQSEKEKTEKIAGEIAEAKENIHNLQTSIDALSKEKEAAEQEYASTHAIYASLKEQESQLLNEIGGDTVTSLLEKEKMLHDEIAQLKNNLAHETHQLNETTERHARVTAQKEEFETRRNYLTDTLHKLTEKIEEKSKVLETIESDIQEKMAQLKAESNSWLEKIKIYKTKLLQLRENR